MGIDQIIACAASVITCISFVYLIGRNFKSDIMLSIERMDKKIDRLDEKVQDMDRRLCRMEGALSSRDFCGLRDQYSKKAE